MTLPEGIQPHGGRVNVSIPFNGETAFIEVKGAGCGFHVPVDILREIVHWGAVALELRDRNLEP